MKGRIVILDMINTQEAAALIVDGVLEDLVIDPVGDAPLTGAIYRAVADRPFKGQGGLFVKLPNGSGFLRQTSGIAPGDRLLVQVTGPAEPGKATPVTTRLLFKSRYAILTPGAPGLNVSRKIRDDEVRQALSDLTLLAMKGAADDLGVIVRSASEAADEDDVARDISEMRALAEAVLVDVTGAPELLVEGASAQETAWRDWADPAPDEVIDTPGCFADNGMQEMLDQLRMPRVPLSNGGHMMIEPTRALVSIDVNTGPDMSPAASLKANIAAARDLPRQLRLRGLGGQIVVDFAPMPKKDRAILDQVLRGAFKGDSAETNLAGWTTLGLFELTRKRDRPPLSEILG